MKPRDGAPPIRRG